MYGLSKRLTYGTKYEYKHDYTADYLREQARQRAIDELTPGEAKKRKKDRIAQLRRQIEADKRRIAEAEAEIAEWQAV